MPKCGVGTGWCRTALPSPRPCPAPSSDTDSIDPRSPYAFTVNLTGVGLAGSKGAPDATCTVVAAFLAVSLTCLVIAILYISQCTHAMTPGMPDH